MNIELNQEELNILIESLTTEKNSYLSSLIVLLEDENVDNDEIITYRSNLNQIYNLKSKLCNYSIQYQEEN